VSELEVLVGAAVARGVEATRCRDIIHDAVRRARRKASMLAHLDSSLLLSTLEVRAGRKDRRERRSEGKREGECGDACSGLA
jgi:hypothetical protein